MSSRGSGSTRLSVDGATPSDGRKRLLVSIQSREKLVDVWLSDQRFLTEVSSV